MKIKRLDHVNVRTSALDKMVEWYTRILGLRSGARPDFGFGGAWLYVNDDPVLHLVEMSEECASIEPKIEHFAFTASGYPELIQRLQENDEEWQTAEVPGLTIVQVNVSDPDGNHIHIDFDAKEV